MNYYIEINNEESLEVWGVIPQEDWWEATRIAAALQAQAPDGWTVAAFDCTTIEDVKEFFAELKED